MGGRGTSKGGKGIFAMFFWRNSNNNSVRGERSSGAFTGKEVVRAKENREMNQQKRVLSTLIKPWSMCLD